MTKEEKDLLLKDLSARLPYGIRCSFVNYPRLKSRASCFIDNARPTVSRRVVALSPQASIPAVPAVLLYLFSKYRRRFNDSVSTRLFVVEVKSHCEEGVELGKVYHNYLSFCLTQRKCTSEFPIPCCFYYIIGKKSGTFN